MFWYHRVLFYFLLSSPAIDSAYHKPWFCFWEMVLRSQNLHIGVYLSPEHPGIEMGGYACILPIQLPVIHLILNLNICHLPSKSNK